MESTDLNCSVKALPSLGAVRCSCTTVAQQSHHSRTTIAQELQSSKIHEQRSKDLPNASSLRSGAMPTCSPGRLRARVFSCRVKEEEASPPISLQPPPIACGMELSRPAAVTRRPRPWKGGDGHLLTFAIAYSPDDTHALIGYSDTTAKVWCRRSGKLILTLQGHRGAVTSTTFSSSHPPHRALTGSSDTTAKLWCLVSGKCLLTLQGHHRAVVSVASASDCSKALTGSADCTVKLWCTETGVRLQSFAGGWSNVMAVTFLPCSAVAFLVLLREDTSTLAVVCDAMAVVCDAIATTTTTTTVPLHGFVHSISFRCKFSKRGDRVIVKRWDSALEVWCARTGARE